MSNASVLMEMIQEFVDANGKDERYKDAIEHLREVQDELQETMPETGPSAGDRAVTAANSGNPEHNRRPLPEEPAESQPKTFASASQAARSRMQEARAS